MMNITKEQILQLIKTGREENIITKEDVLKTIGINQSNEMTGIDLTSQDNYNREEIAEKKEKVSLTDSLQYIGGVIIFVGLFIFAVTVWEDMSPLFRVVISLGPAIILYIIGSLMINQDEKKTQLSLISHLIAGAIFPIGIFVVFKELFNKDVDSFVVAITSLFLVSLYLLSYFKLSRDKIFTLFVIIYATVFMYASINEIFSDISYEYILLINIFMGIIWIFIAYIFKGTKNGGLSGLLYFAGSSIILVSWGLLFETWPVFEALYVGLLITMFFTSYFIHSKYILMNTIIALMAYIMYLTGEYFVDIIGWPSSLVITGMLLILIGYIGVRYKDKIYVK